MFAAWAQYTFGRRKKAKARLRALRHWRLASLRQTMRHWRSRVEEKRLLRRVMQRWVDGVALVGGGRGKMLRTMIKHKCWDVWRRQWVNAVRKRLKGKKAGILGRRSLCRRMLFKWNDFSKKQRLIKSMLLHETEWTRERMVFVKDVKRPSYSIIHTVGTEEKGRTDTHKQRCLYTNGKTRIRRMSGASFNGRVQERS